MSDKREKKNSVNTEQIFDVICLIASYGILFMIPQNINIFFYLIVGVSAFLFCIGFFRLGLSFDVPASSMKTALRLRGSAALIILFGFVLIILKHFSQSSVIAGIMLLIESICLWRMGGNSKSFNEVTPEMQAVPGMEVPIEQLQMAFSDIETQLGYPWIGKLKSIEQDAIIYGPSEDGFVIYGYYLFGRFYVAGSTNVLFPEPEDSQGHLVEEIPDSDGTLLAKDLLTKAYAEMFTRYAESGEAHWRTNIFNL